MHIVLAVLALLVIAYLVFRLLQSPNAANDAGGDQVTPQAAGLEIAFLSSGKLFYKPRHGTVTQIHSPYIQEVTDRVERQKERHAWKQNTSFEIAAFGGRKQFDGEAQITTTAAHFDQGSTLLYCLSDPGFGGLFAYDVQTGSEQRLLHRQNLMLTDLSVDAGRQKILCSSQARNGVAHIAILNSDGSQFRPLTGGDTFDSAPAWIPGDDEEIVYQSCGLARAQQGYIVAQGNATIQLLNMKSGSVTPVLEDPRFDFLQPRVDVQGNLYFIRRPYEAPKYGADSFVLDTLLFPFRLLRAIFHYLNFFSMMYSRKPLTSASGPALHADLKDIIVKGKRIDAEKALRKGMLVNGVPSLVPASWQLVRRTRAGAETVLATHVASYDLTADGRVIYSNGRAVFLLDDGGKPQLLLKSDLIGDVLAYKPATALPQQAQAAG